MMSQDEPRHRTSHAVASRDAGEEIAAGLVAWSRRPRGQMNRATATHAALALVVLTVLAWQMPDHLAALRYGAMMFVFGHAMAHVIVLRGLRQLLKGGIAGADEALAAYLDPRRLSSLDMAMAWLGLVLILRLLGATSLS
jgi:hypothetical protein